MTKKNSKIKSGMNEFKQFIMRGNILDMAVGVIIGGAFGKIVSSLVNDILMPFIGLLLGGHDFSSLSLKIGEAVIQYGVFIQNVVDFLIIAISIFILIKVVNKLYHKKEEKKAPEKSKGEVLLEEIRDLLKEGGRKK